MATGIGVATSLYGLYEADQQAAAIERQSKFNAMQTRKNADNMDKRAGEVIEIGQENAVKLQQDAKKMVGTQKVNFAAQGIDLDSDLVKIVQSDTNNITAEDVQTIKNNAWKEAWGMKTEAEDMRMRADMGIAAGKEKSRATLVSGGLRAAQGLSNSYASYKRG